MTLVARRFCFLSLLLFFSALEAEHPVIYLRLADSLTIDPGKIEEFYSQEVIFNVFEGLVRLRQDRMEAEPCLAERWLSRENGRHWIFYLRRGVKFHNGDAFDARAVVYTFKKRIAKRAGEYAYFGRLFPYIVDVRALDDWTVEFLLSRPYTPFPLALVDQRACIVAPGSLEGAPFKAIGTGPFVLSEWTRGKAIVLSRFDSYWQRPAGLARIVFKPEPNAAFRLSQIKNHSADIDLLRSAKEYEELLGRTDIQVVSAPVVGTEFLGFNCRRPPFSSPPARRAFFHLLDRAVLIKQIFQNFALPATSIMPPMMMGFDPQIGKDDFSLEKAQRLLSQAGLGGGFACRLYYPEGQFGLEDLARTIVANARLVGISVKGVKLPFARLLQAIQSGEADMFMIGWGYTGDPGVFMNPLYMLDPGGRGRVMAAGPDFARLLTQAEATDDDGRRGELYAAAQRRLQEDMPLIPLYYLTHVVAYNRRLQGLRMNPFGFILFRDVEAAAE